MFSEDHFIIDIGQHKGKNLPPVIKLLSSRNIQGINIFTEASDSEVKRKHPFYGRLSRFLSKQHATEIHEPEYEASMKQVIAMYKDTLSPELKAFQGSSFSLEPQVVISEFERLNEIMCQVRDPIIARKIIENAAVYSIFGSGHIPGVLAILRDQAGLNIEVISP